MITRVTMPARVNILGNPTDGNEGDFYTISGAVNIYGGAVIEPSERLTFRYVNGPGMSAVRKSIDETPSSRGRSLFHHRHARTV